MKHKWLWLLSLVAMTNSHAGNYYHQHAEGWHWYDDPKEAALIEQANKKPDPIEQVAAIRENIKRALSTAILEPNAKNMRDYLQLQNDFNHRADQFSTMWQQVLLTHPELNYSLLHPTNQVAIQVYQEEESKKKDAAMAAFKKQYGLFFFYKSTCGYCKRFVPTIINFSKRYNISMVPITLDGIHFPELPHSKRDTGQAQQFHVTVTPAVFAVNPYTQKAFPVAYGLTSETELRDNIYKIMTQYQGVRT